MSITTNSFKTRKASALINLDTYSKQERLIFSKAEGDKPFCGKVYRMSPLIGGGAEFSTVVKALFKGLVDDSVMQVSLVGAPDHSWPELFLKNKDRGGALITELMQQQSKLFASMLNVGWSQDVPALNRRTVYITLAVPIKQASARVVDEVAQLHGDFLTNLRGCGFHDAEALTAEEVVGTYRHFADIYAPVKPVKLDDLVELKYQVFGPDNSFDFRDDRVGVFNQDTYCTAVTCKSFPVEPSLSLMNLLSGAPFNRGSTKEGGGQRILTPFILSATIRVARQNAEWSRVNKAIESRSGTQKKLPIKLGNDDPADKLKDLQVIKGQVGDDAKFVYTSMTAFLFGRTREAAVQAAAVIKGAMDKLDFDGRSVLNNGLVRWAQTLPLNFSPRIANELACEAIMSSGAAGNLLPVFGDFLGNVSSSSHYIGPGFVTRRGQAHGFDPFVSEKSYNGVLAADSGSGKSFALQYLIACELAQGTNVFLLDNGRSAKKFCDAAGGEFNEFGGTFKPSLNPFSGLDDDAFDEQQETITALFILMAYEGDAADPGARIAMNEAVKAAWAQRQSEADLDTVIGALRTIVDGAIDSSNKTQVTVAAANLIPRLKAFLGSPTRGAYFRGKGTLDPKQQFTVFELGNLGDDEHLKKCVLFFVLNLLLTRIKSIPGRKAIYVDEAHDFLKDPSAEKVLEGIYLKGRKDDVSTWIIVQSLLKAASTIAGATMLKQSPWKLVLAQSPEEIGSLGKSNVLTSFAGDAYFEKSIRSVETVKNVFSEILIMGPKTYETVRLYVPRFTATLFSSEGDARETVFELMESGMTAVEAVQKVMGDTTAKRASWAREFFSKYMAVFNLTESEALADMKDAMK